MSDDPKNSFTPRFDDDSVPRFDDDATPGFSDELKRGQADIPESKGASSPVPRFDDPGMPGFDDGTIPRFDSPTAPRFDDDSIPAMDFSGEPKSHPTSTTDVDNYVSSIRQTLVSEESEIMHPRTTGGLIRRITGSLRRVTGSFRRTKAAEPSSTPEEAPAERLPEEELEDDFLAGRLGGAAVEEPGPAVGSGPVLFNPDETRLLLESTPPEPFDLPKDEPVERFETGATAPQDLAAQQPRSEEREQDWMREIRQDTNEAPPPSGPTIASTETPAPKPRGVTGQLRSFVTGILHRKETGSLQISDDMVSGRLERSLTTGKLQSSTEDRPAKERRRWPGEGSADKKGTGSLLRRSSTGKLRTPTGDRPGEQPRLPGEKAPSDLDTGSLPRRPTTGKLPGTSEEAPGDNAGTLPVRERNEAPPQVFDPSKIATAHLEQPELSDLRAELEDQSGGIDTGVSALDRLASLAAEQSEEDLLNERLSSRFFAEEEEADQFQGGQAQSARDYNRPDASIFDDASATAETGELIEDRFNRFGFGQPPEKKPLEPAQFGDFEISPEEETLIWGKPSQPAAESFPETELRPEDIWGGPTEEKDWSGPIEIEPGPTLRPGTGYPEYTDISTRMSDEDYAAAYLTGGEVETPQEIPASQTDRMLREALERSAGEEQALDALSLREIALEGYQGEGLPQFGPGAEGAEESDEEQPFSLKTWLARRSAMEKILLFEAVIVILALLVAVPYFLFVIVRGPVERSAPIQWLVPRPLPANLPYPTGLTLPGGWSFSLQKSTFVEGQWRPASPEWLEGTELRRVVALPWNPQTEAVIQSFEAGDKILLNLSNEDTAKYKVDTIQRVPSGDNSIFDGRKPALVIVLYQEKASERWVVVSSPSR